MRRQYRVADIAAQAGLSHATVDRVLHGRAGVRPETVAQVQRAIGELERQRSQVQLSSKTIILDLVMQAPDRFASECRNALEAELRALRPAVLRVRSNLRETSDPDAAARTLDAIARRGSDGVILKAPDHPTVVEAVGRLGAVGIPVVTFVTDVPSSRRAAYVGVDNFAAGTTAAYLVAHWAGSRGDVLLTVSHSSFRGEEERERGFRSELAALAPARGVCAVTDTGGLDEAMLDAVRAALAGNPSIDAVYSAGGGNRATLSAFAELRRSAGRSSSHTTWTRTTATCCAPAGSRRSCTMTCTRTCAVPPGCCCRRGSCCRDVRSRGRPRFRWSRRTTSPRPCIPASRRSGGLDASFGPARPSAAYPDPKPSSSPRR